MEHLVESSVVEKLECGGSATDFDDLFVDPDNEDLAESDLDDDFPFDQPCVYQRDNPDDQPLLWNASYTVDDQVAAPNAAGAQSMVAMHIKHRINVKDIKKAVLNWCRICKKTVDTN